jgi:hypothetical protein
VSEAVGEALSVELAESVEEGVGAGVPLPVLDGVEVSVGVGVAGGVTLPEWELLEVLLALAPCVSEAVGEALSVLLALRVEDGVGAAVPLPLSVGVGEAVGVREEGGVTLPDSDVLPVLLALAPCVSDDD